jgi:peptidoglycan/xylan/chitin deacetylase (PgdA/CDA1 family)
VARGSAASSRGDAEVERHVVEERRIGEHAPIATRNTRRRRTPAIAAANEARAFEQRSRRGPSASSANDFSSLAAPEPSSRNRRRACRRRAASGGVEDVRRELSHRPSLPRERPPAAAQKCIVAATDDATSRTRAISAATAPSRRTRAGPAARASPSSSSSTTRKAARTTSSIGDAASETFLSELVTAQAYENRHMTMESMYEYGSRVGVWRILREFDRAAAAADGVRRRDGARALSGAGRRVHDAGHEIAYHGLRWIHYQHMPERPRSATSTSRTRVLKELTGGAWPLGWYTGRDSPNTRRLVVEHGGYEYDSDYYGDDLPFWAEVATADGTKAPHLVVPYSLDTNDMRFRPGARLQHRRALLRLPDGRLRALYAEGDRRPRPAEDDVDRHALPAARQARPDRRAASLPRPRPGARAGLDRAPDRHRPPLARRASVHRERRATAMARELRELQRPSAACKDRP